MITLSLFLSFYQFCKPVLKLELAQCMQQMTRCYVQTANLDLPEDEFAMENCSEQIN
jgi:hypothetical protein